MRFFRNVLSQLHSYVLWALMSVLFWGWIFTAFIADAPAEKKVVVFADAQVRMDRELDLLLEEDLPEGIRMVRVHPFSYAMFDDNSLLGADLYIVPASRAEAYAASFLDPPEDLVLGGERPRDTGAGIRGFPAYDARTGEGIAGEYITYDVPGQDPEDYYLFFGAGSLHAASLTGKGDDAALEIARALLDLRGGQG